MIQDDANPADKALTDDELAAWVTHEHFMQLALQQAHYAGELKEVPVGAVIVKHGNVIAAAHNQCEQLHDATAHAEMIASDPDMVG